MFMLVRVMVISNVNSLKIDKYNNITINLVYMWNYDYWYKMVNFFKNI